jgi:hypothetical protein
VKNNYLFLILISFVFLFISCSEKNPVENNESKYSGTWIWLNTVGGIFPRKFTPAEGGPLKISFDEQHLFRKYRNDSLKVICNYNIEEVKNNRDKISYFNVTTYDYYFTSEPEYVNLKNDTLEIWDGVIDGYFSFFKKSGEQ